MKSPELTSEETELYIKIVKEGNYDDMFDFGYAIGRERCARESLDLLTTDKQQEYGE